MTRLARFSITASAVLLAILLGSTLPPSVDAGLPEHATSDSAANSPHPMSTSPQPEPTATLMAHAMCSSVLHGRVPNETINRVWYDPSRVSGWGQLCNPNVPPSTTNTYRTWLSITDPAKPYHPLFNGIEFKCGCP